MVPMKHTEHIVDRSALERLDEKARRCVIMKIIREIGDPKLVAGGQGELEVKLVSLGKAGRNAISRPELGASALLLSADARGGQEQERRKQACLISL